MTKTVYKLEPRKTHVWKKIWAILSRKKALYCTWALNHSGVFFFDDVIYWAESNSTVPSSHCNLAKQVVASKEEMNKSNMEIDKTQIWSICIWWNTGPLIWNKSIPVMSITWFFPPSSAILSEIQGNEEAKEINSAFGCSVKWDTPDGHTCKILLG